jgi:hypothetical protein
MLTLTTADGHRMGSVVVTKKPEHRVKARLEGLPGGARVRMVIDGNAGAEENPRGPLFEKELRVNTATPAFVRVEAYTAEGRALVFSNPIYFRPDSTDTVSAHKRVLCR